MSEVSESQVWLLTWAPIIWYVTAFVAFSFGSGADVFRCFMRTRDSTGRQQIAPDNPRVVQSGFDRGLDRTVWTFSSVWVLIVAAMLGPVLTVPFALAYIWKRGG